MDNSPFQDKEYIEARFKEVFGEAAPRFKRVFQIIFAFFIASIVSGLLMYGVKYLLASQDLRPFLDFNAYMVYGFYINIIALIIGFPFLFIIKSPSLNPSSKEKRFFRILARIIIGGFFGSMILMPIGTLGGALGGYIFAMLMPQKKEANGN